MSNDSNGKVISIFNPENHSKASDEMEKVNSSDSFSEIMRKNAENRDRLKRERLKSNQKVIRSHRLKH